jgi:hypothetical protein
MENKKMVLFEDGHLIHPSFVKFLKVSGKCGIFMVLGSLMYLGFILWILSLGHLCLYRPCQYQLSKIMGNGGDHCKSIEKEGFVTTFWKKTIVQVIKVPSVYTASMVVLFITALLWVLSIGHVYLYRIPLKWLDKMPPALD